MLRPDISEESLVTAGVPSILSPSRSQLCAADPVVQAAVAKFSAGTYFYVEIKINRHFGVLIL
jgi:hypothetical protein